MRNLQVFREHSANLQLDSGESIVATAYDADSATFFLASDCGRVYGKCLCGKDQWATSLLGDIGTGDPAVLRDEDKIVAMEFTLEKEALIVALAGGDILQLDPSSRAVEVVGAIEGGVVNAVLSPDGELLVVATGLGQLLLMTQDWDVLYEVSLDPSLGRSRSSLLPPGSVQITWRGDGKYFCTLEAHNNSQPRDICDSASSIKVWERETGALHSVGEPLHNLEQAISWNSTGSRIATATSRLDTRESPEVVLFERNGLKRSSFDILAPTDARVRSLQWNSNSELLAIVVRCGGSDYFQVWAISNFHWYLKKEWRYSIAEKVNIFWDPEQPLHLVCWTASGCLRRIMLCWKSAVLERSTAFVIDGRNLRITPLSYSIIPPPMFLFRIEFVAPVQTVTARFEDPGRCTIAAGLSDGSLSVVILTQVESWEDLEGAKFFVSPVRSGLGLDFGQIEHISLLGSNTLVGSTFFKPNLSSKDLPSKSSNGLGPAVHDISGDSGCYSLVEFELVEGGFEASGGKNPFLLDTMILRLVSQTALDHAIVAVSKPLSSSLEESESGKEEAYIQAEDGSVCLYLSKEDRRLHPGDHKISPSLVKFISPLPWMQTISLNPLGDPHVVIIGLDEQGRLQVNNQVVSIDCTSFALHEGPAEAKQSRAYHLLFTTRVDKMHVIPLEEILSGGISGEKMKFSTSSPAGKLGHPTTLVGKSRAKAVAGVAKGRENLRVLPIWERGAQLVTSVSGKEVAVILQTVRGNLETLCPRGLLLGAMATALAQDNFEDAVLLARRHHINLNVIIDYKGWEAFSKVAHTFVKQVRNLSHITDVVQTLNEENVMETTYKNLIPLYQSVNPAIGLQTEGSDDKDKSNAVEGSNESESGKVRVVLGAIRSALQKEIVDSPARELCILTTLARGGPSDLEAALERIRALRVAEIEGIDDGKVFASKEKLSAEAGVKHLIWLTDVDIVFRVALGLYDFHLAAMVASHSQKDPKEFLPFLEELRNMPAAQMRYTIDIRLGRLESALRNGAEMGSDHFATCILLIRDNPTLFPCGLRIYKDGEERNVLLDAWGDHLVEENKFESAGATFCVCSQFDKALAAYKQGGLWENAMSMAGRLRKTPEEMSELATELRDELEAMGKPREAAKLALDYCKDVDGAISLLLDAHDWLEVARLAYLYNKADLVSNLLVPSVLECASAQLKELDEGVEKVGKYLARFLAIHQRRLLLAAKLKADEMSTERVEDDASSDISLASSTHSRTSGMSGVTGLSAYAPGSTRTQSSTGSSVSGKGRQRDRDRKFRGGRIRPGSPGEELALVDHLKEMALSAHFLDDIRLLLRALLQLGHESTARRLQHAASRFISVQQDSVRQAAIKFCEETEDKPRGRSDEESHTSRDTDRGYQDVDWQWDILNIN